MHCHISANHTCERVVKTPQNATHGIHRRFIPAIRLASEKYSELVAVSGDMSNEPFMKQAEWILEPRRKQWFFFALGHIRRRANRF